ncbi:XRE family transcriptional regulator [Aneurinibacillus migulanus]|uniref:helix-turn-helix domain-containing protein n=1 Tax=Aneurinibacillus migulanus TaxID=47500 RepID=UPI002E1E6452|nr:XRE family transcriptional regulator [Aneurinibacillus migulanus]
MDAIHVRVGNNLEKIRKKRGLSLDKVSELTGVSKGMLYQIERGDSQPTITTVWKIATGLNLSFSSLIRTEETAVSIVSRAEIPHVTEDNENCKVYLLFPFDPQTRFEIYSIVLHPNGSYLSSPHNEGVYEYITVVSGVFTLKIRDEIFNLPTGDAIRFAGNAPHMYINETDEDVVLQVVMYYTES